MGDPELKVTGLPCRADLPGLLAEVRRSRAALRETQRQRGVSADGVLMARHESLTALETYARALDGYGWPVPPKILLDIHLLRSLCGARRVAPGTRPGG